MNREFQSSVVTAQVLISGRVQGVAFRYFTRRMAQGLSLDGWVRNLPDGRVEARFHGPIDQVRKAIQWCERGPRSARVENNEVTWIDSVPAEENGFEITG